MLRQRLRTAALFSFASLLAAAATSPGATLDVLSTPQKIKDRYVPSSDWDRVRAYWQDQIDAAAAGDAEAQYRVGDAMTRPTTYRKAGLSADTEAGLGLIRRAADAGHPLAQYRVWRLDGGDTDQLVRIYSALDWSTPTHVRHTIRTEIMAVAIERCDAGLAEIISASGYGEALLESAGCGDMPANELAR